MPYIPHAHDITITYIYVLYCIYICICYGNRAQCIPIPFSDIARNIETGNGPAWECLIPIPFSDIARNIETGNGPAWECLIPIPFSDIARNIETGNGPTWEWGVCKKSTLAIVYII